MRAVASALGAGAAAARFAGVASIFGGAAGDLFGFVVAGRLADFAGEVVAEAVLAGVALAGVALAGAALAGVLFAGVALAVDCAGRGGFRALVAFGALGSVPSRAAKASRSGLSCSWGGW